MEALKIYEGVLRELDRFGSPRYDIDDHNYFVNVAKDEVVESLIATYELDQRMTEMLKNIVVKKEIIFNANDRRSLRVGTLDPDFDSLKSCRVVFIAKEDFDCYKKNQSIGLPGRRLTEDSEMFVETNSYYWPSFVKENIYYQTRNNQLEIFYDLEKEPENRVYIHKAQVEYTVNVPDIVLGQDKSNVANSVLHRKVNRKIISLTAMKFLENSKSNRTQSFSQVNQ